MWNHCESRLHTRKQRGQVLRSALTTVSTRAYVSLRVHVHLHRCIHTSTTPAWCNHLFTSFSFPLPISLSLFLSSTREYRHAYTHTHTHRGGRLPLVSVYTQVCVYIRVKQHRVHAHAWKKRWCARALRRAAVPGEDVDIFFTCNERECRERHAFDWPGWRGGEEGSRGGRGNTVDTGGRGSGGGWRGWTTLCRRFFGAFFYGRRPSLAWMNEHGEEHQ